MVFIIAFIRPLKFRTNSSLEIDCFFRKKLNVKFLKIFEKTKNIININLFFKIKISYAEVIFA